MKINEAAEQAGLSKRAVKYYEEQGLLHIKKTPTGTGIIRRRMYKP